MLIQQPNPSKQLLLYHSETQTDQEITQMNADEYEELKVQVLRLQDRVKRERSNSNKLVQDASM